jgi:asparagine synthase (glutamine-hydrolysing)
MTGVLHHRGPDENGTYLTEKFALAHTRLSIIDLSTGQQPMIRTAGGSAYAIVYNGEIYNMEEVRNDLLARGWTFETTSDTEIILVGYMQYGPGIAERLNGIFAFAIADEREKAIFLCRDRSGVKPLFYSILEDGTLVFSSEIKGLFAYPGIRPRLGRGGLNEIFSIGPAKTNGCGVFLGVDELLPAHYLYWGSGGPRFVPYWQLESRPHEDSMEATVEKTGFLVQDAIRRQMVSAQRLSAHARQAVCGYHGRFSGLRAPLSRVQQHRPRRLSVYLGRRTRPASNGGRRLIAFILLRYRQKIQ